MTRWEYTVIDLEEETPGLSSLGAVDEDQDLFAIKQYLNYLGDRGWELCISDEDGICVFKREKSGLTYI